MMKKRMVLMSIVLSAALLFSVFMAMQPCVDSKESITIKMIPKFNTDYFAKKTINIQMIPKFNIEQLTRRTTPK
jgi:hypothetical protein